MFFLALGFDVYYIYLPHFLKKAGVQPEVLVQRLERLGLTRFDAFAVGGQDPYGYEKITSKHSQAIYHQLFDAVKYADLKNLFVDVDQCREKLPALIFGQIVRYLNELGDMLAIADVLTNQYRRVYVLRRVNAIQALAISKNDSGYTNIYPWRIVAVLSTGFKILSYGVRSFKKVFSLIRTERTPQASVAEERDGFKLSQVVYFPQNGVSYGTLYNKDYYYDDDPQSPFHQSKILHIELENRLVKTALDYYRDYNVNYTHMEMPLRLSLSNVKLLMKAFHKIWSVSQPGNGFSERCQATSIMMGGYISFLRGWEKFTELAGVQLALVGYDKLFPIPYVLALQSRGIKVATMQERIFHTFDRSFQPVFDAYYISGPSIRESFLEKEFKWFGELVTIGLVRSELIKKYRAEKVSLCLEKNKSPDKLTVVLDFSTIEDPFWTFDNPLIDRGVNKAFYQDIIRLAKMHLDTHFVIRGKNDHWCSMPHFSDVMKQIDSSPNIEVSHNYEVLNLSYIMVAAADLVIGRQSSLGDEAMSVGIPVLFHDWTPLRQTNISEVCSYDEYPVYVHSFDELAKRTQDILSGGKFMDEQLFTQMQEELYSASSEYPRRAMLDHLRSMVHTSS